MRQRVDQLGVSEPEISTYGHQPDRRRAARRPEHRARRGGGRHDRPAVLLRLGGQRAHAERQDGREPAPDPGPDRVRDQPGAGSAAPGEPGAGSTVSVSGGQAGVQAAVRRRVTQRLALRPPVLHVRQAGQRRLRGGRAGWYGDDRRPAPPVLDGPDDTPSGPRRSRRARRRPAARGRPGPDPAIMPAGHGRAAGGPDELREAADGRPPRAPSSSCSRTTSRCAARTSPTRSRSTDTGGNPDVDVRLHVGKGGNEFQNVTATIAKRGQLGQRRSGQTLQTSTSRSRSTTSWSPSRRSTTRPTRTGSRRQRRRHHRRLHDQLRAGPRQRAAPRRAADQAEADLRVRRSRRRSASRRCTRACSPARSGCWSWSLFLLVVLPRAGADRGRRAVRLRRSTSSR